MEKAKKENHSREKRIKECKTCNGNPPKSEFFTSPFKGVKCDTCFEIISYEKVRAEVKKKK